MHSRIFAYAHYNFGVQIDLRLDQTGALCVTDRNIRHHMDSKVFEYAHYDFDMQIDLRPTYDCVNRTLYLIRQIKEKILFEVEDKTIFIWT